MCPRIQCWAWRCGRRTERGIRAGPGGALGRALVVETGPPWRQHPHAAVIFCSLLAALHRAAAAACSSQIAAPAGRPPANLPSPLTERDAHAALVGRAAGLVLRVAPQHLAHQALLGRLPAGPVAGRRAGQRVCGQADGHGTAGSAIDGRWAARRPCNAAQRSPAQPSAARRRACCGQWRAGRPASRRRGRRGRRAGPAPCLRQPRDAQQAQYVHNLRTLHPCMAPRK